MHVLIGIGLLAAFIGFAFGETAARMFVGTVLAAFAGVVLLFAYEVLHDDAPAKPHQYPAMYARGAK